jgi:hypothetical protein
MRIVADPDAGVVRAADEAGVAVKAPGRMKARVNTAGLYRAVDLGDGPWEASAEFWAEAGLRASSTRTGEQLHFALATPFVRWRASDATVLPGGVVVYALGPHIVSLDLATHRLAVLAEGSCPVVALADR